MPPAAPLRWHAVWVHGDESAIDLCAAGCTAKPTPGTLAAASRTSKPPRRVGGIPPPCPQDDAWLPFTQTLIFLQRVWRAIAGRCWGAPHPYANCPRCFQSADSWLKAASV